MMMIRTRLDRCVRGLSPRIRRDTEEYLRRARQNHTAHSAAAARAGSLAYWILLPSWLAQRRSLFKGAARKALPDILWGQYCLYLAVRIRDDLLDKQTRSRNLSAAADWFLDESQRTFLKYFDRSSAFWRGYRGLVKTTNAAIQQVFIYQRVSSMPAGKLKGLYGKQSAIFKAGSLAMCLMSGKRDIFQRISKFADHLAIADQIIDDLRDVEDDLAQGRLNYAARILLRNPARPPFRRSRLLSTIAEGVFSEKRVAKLFSGVRAHLQLAKRAIRSVGLSQSSEYLESFRAILDKMEMDLHKKTVEYTFARIL